MEHDTQERPGERTQRPSTTCQDSLSTDDLQIHTKDSSERDFLRGQLLYVILWCLRLLCIQGEKARERERERDKGSYRDRDKQRRKKKRKSEREKDRETETERKRDEEVKEKMFSLCCTQRSRTMQTHAFFQVARFPDPNT